MPVDQLSEVVALLAALSVASERLVEILKGLTGWFQKKPPDPAGPNLSPQEQRTAEIAAEKKESRRKAWIQLLAVGCGIATTALAWPMVGHIFSQASGVKDPILLAGAVGLLASGGSGFWNSIQAYLLAIKEIKKGEVPKNK